MLDVRSCASLSEAAGILSGDRHAVLLGGGTLVMRDVNEGRLTEGTLLRVTDPAFRRIETGGRIELGAGVTMGMILAERELSFLHAPARAIGGPAVRNMASIGGNLFASAPYGDFTVALLALPVAGSMGLSGSTFAPEASHTSAAGQRRLASLITVSSFCSERPGGPSARVMSYQTSTT